MKNAFYGLKKKLDTTEERINDLKDKSIETSEVNRQRKKKKNEQNTCLSGTIVKDITHA